MEYSRYPESFQCETTKNWYGGPGSHRQVPVSSDSVSINDEYFVINTSFGARPVSKFSIQTGEEFALEFMMEQANKKKTFAQNESGGQNISSNAISRNTVESPYSVSGFVLEMRGCTGTGVRNHNSLTVTSSGVSPYDSRGVSRGMSFSSSSCNIKVLCSFGGKILRRPSDGKLRYAGGDTRIIRLHKDISWQEMQQKTYSIYITPHMIKYQLPGEELDALVTVSCDEDLQNMMIEINLLEESDKSQKLRMFLFSSTEIIEMQFSLGSIEGDSEFQYMVAVNGMDHDTEKSLSIYGGTSTVAYNLDQLLNSKMSGDSGHSPTAGRVGMEPAQSTAILLKGVFLPSTTTSVISQDEDLHGHLESGLHVHYGFTNHVGDSIANNATACSSQNAESRTSMPSTTSHYGISVNPTASQSPEQSRRQILVKDFYDGFKPSDPKLCIETVVSDAQDSLLLSDNAEQTRFVENEHLAIEHFYHNFCPTCKEVKEEPHGTKECIAPLLSAKENMDIGQSNSTYDSPNLSQIQKTNDCEAFGREHDVGMMDRSQGVPLAQSCRVYQSLQNPRKLVEIVNRLSKSNDPNVPQFVVFDSHRNLLAKSSSSGLDPFCEGGLIGHPEETASGVKCATSNPKTVRNGLKQVQNYRKFADSITQTDKRESLLNLENQEKASISNVHVIGIDDSTTIPERKITDKDMVNINASKTYDQSEHCSDGQIHLMELNFQESDPSDSEFVFVNDKKVIDGAKILVDNTGRTETCSLVVANDIINGPNSAKETSSSEKGVDTSKLSDINIAISSEQKHLGKAPVDDAHFVLSGDSPVAFSEVEASNCDSVPVKNAILNDINDRFPPHLLFDIFFKARIFEDSSEEDLQENKNTILSMNLHNPEPRSWSFFRNLAQDQFTGTDGSLSDQNYNNHHSPLSLAEYLAPWSCALQPSGCEKIESGNGESQDDFHQATFGIDGGESSAGLQVENPFFEVGESLTICGQEYKEVKSEYEDFHKFSANIPVDIGLSGLQTVKNEDLEELKELGSGTFGTVYHGKWRGTDVAIKRIKNACFTGHSSQKERLLIEFWREAGILSTLHHPNVVAFYGVVRDGPGETLATITEFMVNGSLRQVLLQERDLDFHKRLMLAADAAFGLEYLHSKNIVHFDLKCDNLLVNLSDPLRPICKVSDFGLSKIKQHTFISGGLRGTLPWMAPELFTRTKVSDKVDVFSFGIVMWEILTGKEPYANSHCGFIIGGIVSNQLRPPIPMSCDPEWRQLMEQCWHYDPAQRPSFVDIAKRLRLMSTAYPSSSHETE